MIKYADENWYFIEYKNSLCSQNKSKLRKNKQTHI